MEKSAIGGGENRRRITRWIPAGAALLILLGMFVWSLARSHMASALTEQLVRAIQLGDASEAERLLKRGADPDGVTTVGLRFTSLREFVQTLFGPRRKEREWTPLRLAIQLRRPDLAKLLLRNGAKKVNTPGRNMEKRESLLLSAITLHDAELVEMLLDRGADVRAKNWIGDTPAHYAVFSGVPRILELVLLRGADPEAADVQNRTVFQAAAGSPKGPEFIPILLERKADPNRKGQAGWTPLHIAAMFGKAESARALIAAGANVNSISKHGATPLQTARRRRHTAIIRILERAGAK